MSSKQPGSGTALRWSGPYEAPAALRRYCKVFQAEVEDGHLSVIVGREPRGWHLSISHRLSLSDPMGRSIPGRIPTYEELKSARYEFIPDEAWVVQVFPPRAEFLNAHPTTLHLHEVSRKVGEDVGRR